MSKLKKFFAICSTSVAAFLVSLPAQACFSPFGLGFGGLGFSTCSSFMYSSMYSGFGFGFSPFWW